MLMIQREAYVEASTSAPTVMRLFLNRWTLRYVPFWQEHSGYASAPGAKRLHIEGYIGKPVGKLVRSALARARTGVETHPLCWAFFEPGTRKAL